MDRFRNEAMNRLTKTQGQRACAVLCFIAAALHISESAGAEIVDSIVAVVDREVILQSDLMDVARDALNELRGASSSDAEFNREADALLRDILEEQIDNKLLIRQAPFLGISVEEDEVEANIADIRNNLEMSYEEFLTEIQSWGLTMSELRERRRKVILALRTERFKLRDFEREIVVSEEDVLEYYEEQRGEFERPEEIQVSQIQLQAGPDPAERARARARLESLRRELDAGANFAELARLHSQDMFAENGGLMGWVRRDLLQPELEDAAFALPVGGVTEVIETRVGLHLLRVDDRREAGLRTVDQVRGEIAGELRAHKAAVKYERWLSDLRKRSRVRVFY